MPFVEPVWPLTAGLFGRLGGRSLSVPFPVPGRLAGEPGPSAGGAGRLTRALSAGEDSQLVTIRLPAERHAALREWCAVHEFTMAAVIRGLVERFLEQQQRAGEG